MSDNGTAISTNDSMREQSAPIVKPGVPSLMGQLHRMIDHATLRQKLKNIRYGTVTFEIRDGVAYRVQVTNSILCRP